VYQSRLLVEVDSITLDDHQGEQGGLSQVIEDEDKVGTPLSGSMLVNTSIKINANYVVCKLELENKEV
jgi:hypothetical protein